MELMLLTLQTGAVQEDGRNAVDFSKDGERIWLLEDYKGTRGEYFIMNTIMTKFVDIFSTKKSLINILYTAIFAAFFFSL